MEVRSNGSFATADFSTWSGESSLDEPNKKFKATAKRHFNHVDKDREMKLGVEHKWGTIFKVKDANKNVKAMGMSKTMNMVLTAENGFSASGAANLSGALVSGL